MSDPRYREHVAGTALAYVSDYLSFVGADEHGPVAFALDTNRGRDGDALQADHGYAVLHDARRGWVPLEGRAAYPHPGPAVEDLPSSAWFAFGGGLEDGLVVESPANGLRLEVDPLTDRLVGRGGEVLFAMRTAAAVLRWDGRTVPGRLIHEGLAMRERNLLTRRSFRGIAPLEFLYLTVGPPDRGAGDLYLQLVEADGAPGGLPAQTGFADAEVLRDVSITTTQRVLAPGLHRWPSAWRATWDGGRAELRTVSRLPVARWGLAGLAMSVVRGELVRPDGTTLPLYGLAEVLTLGPVLRALVR